MTIPLDTNTSVKTTEKLTKYKDLEIEVERMWGLKATAVLVVMGALGTIKEDMENRVPPKNPWQHKHTRTPENNSPFYSPPSQAGPLHQVETLFATQSLWFGLGCGERKSIAITLVYLTYQATIGLETYLRNADDALLQLVLQQETQKKPYSTQKEAEIFRREFEVQTSIGQQMNELLISLLGE